MPMVRLFRRPIVQRQTRGSRTSCYLCPLLSFQNRQSTTAARPPSSSSPSSTPSHSTSPSADGANRAQNGPYKTAEGAARFNTEAPRRQATSASIRALVRDAVLNPHQDSAKSGSAGPVATASSPPSPSDDSGVYDVHVFDRNGMPADLPADAPRSFEDLLNMTPDPLRRQLQDLMQRKRWTSLTSVQKHVIPFILEYRDVLCVAPTATGKTFAYVYPTMLRLLLDEQQAQRGRTRVRPDGTEDHAIQRHDVERLLQEKINRGEVCRYCELDVRVTRVCPMTGSPHAPPQADGDSDMYMGRERRAQRLQELTSTASPKALVLVPTSQLAYQVHGVFESLHSDFIVRYMVRASSAEEQQKYLRALQDGVDVLITTPETILPALFKRKLSLQQVRTVVLDEVDDLVSVNHYEKLKIILGALPRASAAERPQRLLFGASLPPVAYNMLKERTLQPSHRFILADIRRDRLGRPVTAPRVVAAASGAGADLGRGSGAWLSPSTIPVASTAGQQALLTINASIQHFVLMLGRVEKIHKLAWLYQTGKLTVDQRVLIFCNSRHNVAYIAEQLPKLVPGLNHVTTITSHASATARAGVMKQFSSGLSTCMVATDIMSRGIDFHDVIYVVNYDMPGDMETFIHRCGRCGRRQPSQWMPHEPRQTRAAVSAKEAEEDETVVVAPTKDAHEGEREEGDADSLANGQGEGNGNAEQKASEPAHVVPHGTSGYVYTFFQPENVKLAKPLVAYLRQNGQLVPPALGEYARQSFVDVFRNSLFHHPTRPYRKSDPQNSTPVNGRGAPRYPDFKQEKINRHFRPL